MSEGKGLKVRRALISVFDKSGLNDIVDCLVRHNVEIISSGGTAKAIRARGRQCIDVSEYTGYPESPDGLVKTLQPKIHGGLLLDEANPVHKEYMEKQGIPQIDMVVVNLYPFTEVASTSGATEAQVHEMIDIGGPAMVRASGKGALLHGHPCIVIEPSDYKRVIEELDRSDGSVSGKLVRELALKAFELTAKYDASIVHYLNEPAKERGDFEPVLMTVSMKREDGSVKWMSYDLKRIRSGDNPHQSGFVGEPIEHASYKEVIPGRGMGFTNHIDLQGYAVAFEIMQTMKLLKDPRIEVVVVNKHTNPAVFAARTNQLEALTAALSTDRKSPFGGALATSSMLKLETAQFLAKKNKEERFVLDVLASPGFEPGAVDALSSCMKNLRIIDVSPLDGWTLIHAGMMGFNMKWTIGGKPVITGLDKTTFFNAKHGMEVLSKRQPTQAELTDAHIAWIGCKAVQSNSFAFVKDAVLLAQCGGQTNREDSAKFAKIRADEFNVSLEGSAAATDSFIFDHTTIDMLHGMGVRTVIHPTRKLLTTGNLKPDQQILAKVDEYEMVMIRPYLIDHDGNETPWRVFKHL